ncbi:glycosyltransferase family 2 protein [Leuconostoc lactis]|uniref:glycosyltransferase family 2 protein n=1 Tax=Leuconostoc lactis TaxID=1246 RepID=UPI0024AD1E00|nr:hypothetical protein [Leuconostoc lactis]MDI6572594.1 hypothetical protein [Leuconostoc lactis]
MKKVEICFVILTYNGFDDFKNLYESFSLIEKEFAVVLVDSFSNIDIKNEGIQLSRELGIDFLSVPNKGYGAGNNAGIAFALKNYDFEYIVIANPDVIIKKMDYDEIVSHGNDVIIGPSIKNLNNREQNPLYFKKYSLPFFILKLYVKKGYIFFLYLYLIVNKFFAQYYFWRFRKTQVLNVYALHGSFMIIGKKALEQLIPLFDERMFLYAEENHVAEKAKAAKVQVILDKNIAIQHKEDGSTGESGRNQNQIRNTLHSLRIFFSNKY